MDLPDDGFLWTYAGNVGIAQDLETALDAAALLGPGFRLLILGAGPRLEALRERARSLPDSAVEFRGLVQPDVAIRYMRASDALLVPLKDQPGLTKFVPSKLFDCCAVGRPVVVAASGEASRLAAEASAALTVAPGDAEALAGAIRSLRDQAALGEGLAAAGRQFAAQYLRERQAERLNSLIYSLRGYR
jgi:glycosyltransferase involved in cell wall biosynthesis